MTRTETRLPNNEDVTNAITAIQAAREALGRARQWPAASEESACTIYETRRHVARYNLDKAKAHAESLMAALEEDRARSTERINGIGAKMAKFAEAEEQARLRLEISSMALEERIKLDCKLMELLKSALTDPKEGGAPQ